MRAKFLAALTGLSLIITGLNFTYGRLRESNVEPDDQGFDAQFIFANTFENEGTRAETYSARLFSQWSDNLSTELRVSRNDIQDLQRARGRRRGAGRHPDPDFPDYRR